MNEQTKEWINWNGGAMPVDGETLVDVEFNNGNWMEGLPASMFDWQKGSSIDYIIKYKVSQE